MHTKLLALAALATFALSPPALAADDGQTGASRAGKSQLSGRATQNCRKLPFTEVAQSSVGQSTSLNTFVDVVGSSFLFNANGSSPNCVLVDFQAQAFAPGNGNILFVRAVVDNAVVSADGEIQLQSDSNTFSNTHGYNFIFPSIAPGIHSFKMQFRSQVPGNSVFINDFDLQLAHR